ncbi:trans-sulfuration enzyme family protein [Peribacillus sp. SCS-155]|uniref:trans-sulfuration enzyme family protein n=1 Tax=Peribacillus sedimenti TaxID=3115297 RepID=UPI0039064798
MTFEEDTQICMGYSEQVEHFMGAAIPPIFGNTLFTFSSFENLVDAVLDEPSHYVYTRGKNPTVEIVEKKLAALERGEACKCFGSGMAAISAAILSSIKADEHVLCVGNIYFSTKGLLNYLSKFGVSHTIVLTTDPLEIERNIRANTAVIYFESPTDMSFQILDLETIAAMAKKRNILTIVDNTWATPLFQKPLTFGIDIVVHSASKYLGGHSDLMGGAMISSEEIIAQVFKKEFLLFGAVLSPYDASLLLRGLRTLPFRMKAHQQNALKTAEFLDNHPAVAKVNYPGHSSHPQYELTQKQMNGFSGLMSFELKNATFDRVAAFINSLNTIKIGVSWGSFESLVISPNYGNNLDKLQQEDHLNPGLIRLSVGLENIDAIIGDIKQALNA